MKAFRAVRCTENRYSPTELVDSTPSACNDCATTHSFGELKSEGNDYISAFIAVLKSEKMLGSAETKCLALSQDFAELMTNDANKRSSENPNSSL